MSALRPTKAHLLVGLIAFNATLLVRLLGGDRLGLSGLPELTLPLVLGALLVAIAGHWVGVLAHELGHAAVAYVLGLRVRAIGLGPVSISWLSGAPRLRRSMLNGIASGYMMSTAGELPPALWLRASRWSTLAGPLAGGAWGVIALALAGLAGSPPWLHAGLALTGWFTLLINAVNLIPLRLGPVMTDGAHLVALVRGGERAETAMTISRWMDLLLSPDSPGNWPDDLIRDQELALATPDPRRLEELATALLAGHMLYLHYADRFEWSEAHHVITRAVDLPRPPLEPKRGSPFDAIDVNYAIHLALRGDNALAARATLNRIGRRSTVRRNSLFAGAEAAIALVQDDPRAALEHARTALKRLDLTTASPGCDRLEATWWEQVMERARELEAARREGRRPEPAIALPTTGGAPGSTSALPPPPPIAAVAGAVALFAWDPGVAPEQRMLWIWRAPAVAVPPGGRKRR